MATRVTRGRFRCKEFEVVRGEVGDTVAERAVSNGGRTFGFSCGMPGEHKHVIGFIRRRLNLHKSKIEQAWFAWVCGSWTRQRGSDGGSVWPV